MGLKENQLSLDIVIVETFFFQILEDIIINGFLLNNEKYVCFTASAGQIRTKKTVFIKESLLQRHRDTLMCGLPPDKINSLGGVNINKYLAYLALCNSATDEWKDIDINKVIVVDDMETLVRSVVDYIDEKTYSITRKEMDVRINHTDGCGMILPKKSRKSFMIRMPWIKGLLVPFPYDKFIREANRALKNGFKCGTVTDIYGKQYNLLEDNIEIILTKSQFKMWKYYSSWDEYKEKYIKHNCQTGICNVEEDNIGNAKINYQMLQTLTDITDDELEELCSKTKETISKIGTDRKTMLKVLGVSDSNESKNYFQRALEIYPELLADTYSKEILKQVKKSIVKNARAGKLDIEGKYTFLCPDLYAFCEYLILDNKEPKGLLANGEVYCCLYKETNYLNCLRSPHLYREHAIRHNISDKVKSKWFITKGLYTSCHDPISKILQFDVDGDKALVCADNLLIRVADRNMNDIVPLYYEMAKAEAEVIDNQSIFNGLRAAYTGGNIGVISNDITKIWNSEQVNLDVIKWLCMENNFVIDYAKTLYKPIRPKEIGTLIHMYTKSKVPHFFMYAKNKEKHEVEKINNSTINKLEKIINNPRLNFRASNIGKFNYKMLLSNKSVNVDLNKDIIDKYSELETRSHFMINKDTDENSNIPYLYQSIKEEILEVNSNINYVVDVLIEYLYKYKRSSFKATLWECFGEVILINLSNNIHKSFKKGYILCDSCGTRTMGRTSNKKYCEACARKIKRTKK
ncbi:DNA-directed RNA polymerase YonO [Paenibacillus vulneris]